MDDGGAHPGESPHGDGGPDLVAWERRSRRRAIAVVVATALVAFAVLAVDASRRRAVARALDPRPDVTLLRNLVAHVDAYWRPGTRIEDVRPPEGWAAYDLPGADGTAAIGMMSTRLRAMATVDFDATGSFAGAWCGLSTRIPRHGPTGAWLMRLSADDRVTFADLVVRMPNTVLTPRTPATNGRDADPSTDEDPPCGYAIWELSDVKKDWFLTFDDERVLSVQRMSRPLSDVVFLPGAPDPTLAFVVNAMASWARKPSAPPPAEKR